MSAPEAVRDRDAAVAAEGLLVHLDAGRRLPALVFGEVDEARDALRHLERREAPAGDLLGREVVLDVGLEQRIELLVGRQRLVVALIVAQLGRGRALDDRGAGSAPGRPAR